MRLHIKMACLIFAGLSISNVSRAADFPYSIDATVYYQGDFPTDGRYLIKNFLFAAKPTGVITQLVGIFADFSTGPNTPIVQSVSCGVGAIPPGWTVAYRGVSCNWPAIITIPPGAKLYASVHNSFGPYVPVDPRSTVPVVTEKVKPYPAPVPPSCAAPAKNTSGPIGGPSSISVDVYQMPGAIAPDGTLDQTRICVVAHVYGQDVVGLAVWGSLTARHANKETYVGSYICPVQNVPNVTPAGTTHVCSPLGNNNVPDVMTVPKDAELFVASTVVFGHAQSTPTPPVPVKRYGQP